MKKAFTAGAIAGATALVIAVPLLTQFSFAASRASSLTGQTQTSDAGHDQGDPRMGGHRGSNGIQEELLTGDAAAKANAAALAAVPGGTVDRVETDAEGDVYEAHMTKADGSRVTVKFDANFAVTKIEDGPMMK